MDELPSLIQALKMQGFYPSVRAPDEYRFNGEIVIDDLSIPITLTLGSKYLVGFPTIEITGWRSNLELRARLGIRHISSSGRICYIDESRTVWDATQAIPYILASLVRVHKTLEENVKGTSSPEDIMRDFSGYWGGSDVIYLTSELHNGQLLFERKEKQRRWLVDSIDTQYSIKSDRTSSRKWIAVSLTHPPIPNAEIWPPQNLHQLLNWLEYSNRSISQVITKLLIEATKVTPQAKGYQHRFTLPNSFGLLLYWENQVIGQIYHAAVIFKLPDPFATALLQRRESRIKKMLCSAKTVAIQRKSVEKADPQYVIYRNIPDSVSTLEGKKIVLIGAGAIGGFLAHQLASFGAGSGSGGILTIVDDDTFSPVNVGRHFLGMDSVGQPKATALCERLKLSFPYLTIKAENVSIFDKTKLLAGQSLIVNATGMQTVGIGLEKVMRNYYPKAPILHSWIYGHGLAVQTLLNDWTKCACFRCLWHQNTESNEFSARVPVAKDPSADAPLFGPCHESYYPYPVSAAVASANLTFMVIVDWLSGNPDNRFRTIILQQEKCHTVKDSSLTPSSNCPLCKS